MAHEKCALRRAVTSNDETLSLAGRTHLRHRRSDGRQQKQADPADVPEHAELGCGRSDHRTGDGRAPGLKLDVGPRLNNEHRERGENARDRGDSHRLVES